MYFNFYVLMKVRHPGRNPGTAWLWARLMVNFVKFICYFVPASREGTRRLPDSCSLPFLLYAGKVPSSNLKVKVMYVMWNHLVTRLTNAEMVVKSKEREGGKHENGLGDSEQELVRHTYFFTNSVIFYVGNSVSRNSDCFKCMPYVEFCDSTVERRNGRQEQKLPKYGKHEKQLGDS